MVMLHTHCIMTLCSLSGTVSVHCIASNIMDMYSNTVYIPFIVTFTLCMLCSDNVAIASDTVRVGVVTFNS